MGECIVFNDESMFCTFNNSRIEKIRWFDIERLCHTGMKKTVQHFLQVRVWKCFSRFGVGLFKRKNGKLNSMTYQNYIVGKCSVFPYRSFIFQHDNVLCHRSASIVYFLTARNINILEWPAYSPDPNPIENSWNIIKRKINDLQFSTWLQMWMKIQKIWLLSAVLYVFKIPCLEGCLPSSR